MATSKINPMVTSEVLQTGMTLYRIGNLRILSLNSCVGNDYQNVLSEADRPKEQIKAELLISSAPSDTYAMVGLLTIGTTGNVFRATWSQYNANTNPTPISTSAKASGVAFWTV